MNFKPVNNRILVKPDESEIIESNGVQIAEVKEDRPKTGTIVAGSGEFKENDKVSFSSFGYDELTIEGEKYFVVSVTNILGIFE
jgi:chaperonin GroES